MNKKLYPSAALGVLFVALIVLVKTVDVQAIGPKGTSIGLATVNIGVHHFLGEHLWLYTLTNVLGYGALALAGCMGVLGLLQMVYRKRLFKVDKELLLLGCLYVVTGLFYVLFEKVIINYRPMLLPGEELPEASFPSSHTMLSLVIFASLLIALPKYVKKSSQPGRILTWVLWVCMVVMVVGRLISGVHWFTDILGGTLLGGTLVSLYGACLSLWKQADSAKGGRA